MQINESEDSSPVELSEAQQIALKRGINQYLVRIENNIKTLNENTPNKNLFLHHILSGLISSNLQQHLDQIVQKEPHFRIDFNPLMMLEIYLSGELVVFLDAIHFPGGSVIEDISLKETIMKFSKKVLMEEMAKCEDPNYTFVRPVQTSLFAHLKQTNFYENWKELTRSQRENPVEVGGQEHPYWAKMNISFRDPLEIITSLENRKETTNQSSPTKTHGTDEPNKTNRLESKMLKNPYMGVLSTTEGRLLDTAVIPLSPEAPTILFNDDILDNPIVGTNGMTQDRLTPPSPVVPHAPIPPVSAEIIQHEPEEPESAQDTMELSTVLNQEQQKIFASKIYNKMAQVILDRIAGYSRSSKHQKRHYDPFINNINYLNGVYCTFLPYKDATDILYILNQAIEKIDIATEAGDILCQSVKNLFSDFNAFFLDNYGRSGFGATNDPFRLRTKKRFTFKINNSDDYLKLACLESEILELSRNNKERAIAASKAASSCSKIVTQTLIYNQAQIILNVKAQEQSDEQNYWLICLLQVPSEGRVIDSIPGLKPEETVVRLLLARAKQNNRLDAYFEVSKLDPRSEEYKVAIMLTSKMSKKLQDILLLQSDEYSVTEAISNDYTVMTQGDLRDLVMEIVENNSQDIKILPLFAVEKNSNPLTVTNEGDKEKDRGQNPEAERTEEVQPTPKNSRKRKATDDKLSLPSFKPDASAKKLKTKKKASPTSVQPVVEESTPHQAKYYSNLLEYLNTLQQRNLKEVTRISDKVTRLYVQGFNFQKIVKSTPEALEGEEQMKLSHFLDSTTLYPYQKDCVTTLLTAHRRNIGMGLFDEMSLGKTIQIGAVLRYLSLKEESKCFLVVVPLQVLEKWHHELTTKLPFDSEEVVLFHGNKRHISTQTLKSNNVIITTYDTLLAELKQHKQTDVKTAVGYLSKYGLGEFSAKTIQKWEKLSTLLDGIIGNGITKSNKNSKRIKFLRMPTQDEMQLLAEHFTKTKDLKKLFSLELIYQFLNQQGYINKQGAILRPILAIEELDPLYRLYENLYYSKERLFTRLSTIYSNFSVQGIVLDEGHNGLTKIDNQTYLYLQPIAKNLTNRNGLRIISTGTPFQNDIGELWALYEFLNPGNLMSRNEFMAAYENLIFNAGKSICKTAELANTEALDQFQAVLNESVATIKKAYAEIQKIIEVFHTTQIRRTKEAVARLGVQQSNASNGYRMPKRQDIDIPWELSENQETLFNQNDIRAIESACRGFAFFHNAMREFAIETNSRKGYTLLQELAKVFDHPIMISEEHRPALFDPKRTFESIEAYLSKVLARDYDNDIMSFVMESGKLFKLVDILKPLLIDPAARILISTEFIPMAAIIKFVIMRLSDHVEPTIYFGGLSKPEREKVITKFNSTPDTDEDESCKVIIISQKAGSEGIELYANKVISYDQTWTSSLMEQIKNRAVRNGSPYDLVTCITLTGNNPLDQKMANFVHEKMQWGGWFVDALPRCTVTWFVERLQTLIKTSVIFNHVKLTEAQINHAISQIIDQLQMDRDLSLESLQINLIQRNDVSNHTMEPVVIGMELEPQIQSVNQNNPDNMEVEKDPRTLPARQEEELFADFNVLLEACDKVGFFRIGSQSNIVPPKDTNGPQLPDTGPAKDNNVSTETIYKS